MSGTVATSTFCEFMSFLGTPCVENDCKRFPISLRLFFLHKLRQLALTRRYTINGGEEEPVDAILTEGLLLFANS
ncbi:hypothetical protein JCGZ_05155 [Jatropha curcas]|uniref:Uncharacterized protein n=1 Tax=Jatropha curcas TaxID=180498 RepID=A0A067L5U0_JATCU|nr:hypothetical protein JCGZ_05155 [Jatropha curcas]